MGFNGPSNPNIQRRLLEFDIQIRQHRQLINTINSTITALNQNRQWQGRLRYTPPRYGDDGQELWEEEQQSQDPLYGPRRQVRPFNCR